MSKANLVLFSNLIYTGKGKKVLDGGVAVSGSRIAAIGSREEIEPYIDENTKVYEYKDKLIMPGFIDSHLHSIAGMQCRLPVLDLLKTTSKQECLERVTEFLKENPDAEFIYGSGWILDDWDVKEWPRKEDIDAICPDIPVYLADADGWNCWVNSTGLEKMGYTKENVTGEMEKFVYKDGKGELTGITFGEGCEPTFYLAYDLPEEKQDAIAYDMFSDMISCGITTIGELAAETTLKRDPAGYEIFKRLDRKGKLRLKMCLYPAIGKTTDLTKQDALAEDIRKNCSRITVNGLKMFMDGVINGYTAFMMEPYSDKTDERGDGLYSQEQTNELVANANAHGYPVRTHALGDAAVNRMLNAIEYSQKVKGNPKMNNCIEHINFITEDDKLRLGELGVIAAMQPLHLIGYPDSCEPMFGKERWNNSFPLKTLIDKGAVVSLSTDYPIVDFDPFYNIYSALVRNDAEGIISRCNEAEITDIYETLECYTLGSAIALGIEDETGTLEAGKAADIAVLDRRLIDSTPEEILETKVLLTVIEGAVEHEA